MKALVPAAASIVLTSVAVRIMWGLARAWKLERTNFKGSRIPAGFGFSLVMAAAPVYVGMLFSQANERTGVLLAAVLGFGIIGLIDDIYGTREAGGFGGHLGLLRRGKLSTGLMKAAVGGLLGLGLGAVMADFRPAASLLNGLVISLSANLLNLLDLRPGRAVSCFWVGMLALAGAGRLPMWPEIIPVAIPAVRLTVLDRSARVMLGDAGSNVLGAVLGLSLAYEMGLQGKVAYILCLVVVHLYSERYSISKLIENNRLLRGLDRLLGER